MPKRNDSLLIEDIIENAENIFEFVAEESYEQVTNDKMKMYAIIRAFEIIGEATKLVSEEIKIKTLLRREFKAIHFIFTFLMPLCVSPRTGIKTDKDS